MKKLAVCLHFYYKDQLSEINEYLANIVGVDYDLYVTMSQSDESVENAIKTVCPKVKFLIFENKGYDIGPFIEFLHEIDLDNYEYILKLHTKGKKSRNVTRLNGHRMDNALWGKILWDSMLGTQSRLCNNLRFLDKNENVSMMGSQYCFTNNKINYEKLLPRINEELQKMGRKEVDRLSFIAGSMFLVRASCLKPLLQYKIDDFADTDGEIKEGTLAHVIERVFGVLGEELAPVEQKRFFFGFLWDACKRFCYQNKITGSGKRIVKICKIPVYVKKCA